MAFDTWLSQEEIEKYKQAIGPIIIVEPEQTDEVIKKILDSHPKIISMDIEATNDIACLISLSTGDIIYLIRLPKIPHSISQNLIKLLHSPACPKISFGLDMDYVYLKYYNIYPRGMIDIKYLLNYLGYRGGLKKIFAEIFPQNLPMLELYKNRKELDTYINWRSPLVPQMIYYAAYDCRANLMLFQKIVRN